MHEGAVSTRLGLRGWPRVAEDVIVARDVLLAEYVGARTTWRTSRRSARCASCARRKARGIAVTAEVTPHHLLLTDEALLGYDTACKVNPPLREPEDVEALRRALADGTIDCVATDHAPHAMLEKHVRDRRGRARDDRPRAVPAAPARPRARGRSPARPPRRAAHGAPRRASPGSRRRASARGRGPISCSVDPRTRWTIDPARLLTKSQNTPFLGRAVEGARRDDRRARAASSTKHEPAA